MERAVSGPVRRTRRWVVGAGVAGLGLAAWGAAGCAPGASSDLGAGKPAPGGRAPVTIDILTRPGVAAPTGHSQWYAQVAKNSFTPETDVTVNLFDGDPDVTTKLNVLAAAGTPPDGAWFATGSDGAGGREAAQKGVFKPMDELIKKDGKFDTKPYLKALLDIFTVGGKLYGLPLMAHYGTNVLYFNRARWQGAGVTVPADGNWTIEEFVAGGQRVVNKAQDQWAYRPEVSIDQYGVFWVRQFGGEVLDEAGKSCLLDTPRRGAGLEWVYNLPGQLPAHRRLLPPAQHRRHVRIAGQPRRPQPDPRPGLGVQEAGAGAGQVRPRRGHLPQGPEGARHPGLGRRDGHHPHGAPGGPSGSGSRP